MSDSTKSLPTEVWLNIFKRLKGGKQLEQCCLVCRSWRPLVEMVMYKALYLGTANTQLAKVSKYLATRPDLGRLVQKIVIVEKPDTWPEMYKILRLTPNLKVIDGGWSEVLAKKVLPKPECSALKLEKLPCVKEHTELYLKSMLRFKDTLRSAAFSFNRRVTPYDYHTLGNSLNQLKHLQQLTIDDDYAFKRLHDLDHLLKNCNQIQHLQLIVSQDYYYVHTDKAELEQWLANSVQKVETVKTLVIHFKDDSLEDEDKEPHEFGPDWMHYLAYKYPNLSRLQVYGDKHNHQHLVLPKCIHMDTFVLKDWIFYDLDLLKQFINMVATQSVYIKCTVNCIEIDDPYICMMRAVKKTPTSCTTFSIEFACRNMIETDTSWVMPLFSSRLIKKFEIDLHKCYNLEPIYSFMECSLNVESIKITTDNHLLTHYPEQKVLAVLRRLELVNTRIKSDFITQLSKYALKLTHLKLDNCTFGDKVLMPNIQLASLSLQKTSKKGRVHLEDKSHTHLLFRISTNKCPDQMFLASPQSPLQRVTREEAKLLETLTIYIKCGSLRHLSVDLEDIRFEMEFNDADNLIERVDCGIEDSYYTTLERNMKILMENQEKMESRIKVAEDK